MPSLEILLRQRLGVKTKVQLDADKKPTVGIGHHVTPDDSLSVGDEIDDRRVSAFYKKDSTEALVAAKKQMAKARITDKNFIVYLAAVNFQLGPNWFKTMKLTWKLILDG